MNKKEFWKIIVLVFPFFIFGILGLKFSGLFNIKSYTDFCEYISEYLMLFVISGLFLGISLYIYIYIYLL